MTIHHVTVQLSPKELSAVVVDADRHPARRRPEMWEDGSLDQALASFYEAVVAVVSEWGAPA